MQTRKLRCGFSVHMLVYMHRIVFAPGAANGALTVHGRPLTCRRGSHPPALPTHTHNDHGLWHRPVDVDVLPSWRRVGAEAHWTLSHTCDKHTLASATPGVLGGSVLLQAELPSRTRWGYTTTATRTQQIWFTEHWKVLFVTWILPNFKIYLNYFPWPDYIFDEKIPFTKFLKLLPISNCIQELFQF